MKHRSLITAAALLGMAVLATGTSKDPELDSADSGDTQVTDTGDPDLARVVLTTSLGEIVIVLDQDNAPVTTENFLEYIDSGFYDGDDGAGATIFHRVIPGFMVQGGGTTEAGLQKDTLAPIVLEDDNGLSNTRGSIAMARTSTPDSATSQFFINVDDNDFLDGSDDEDGYAVFGLVTSGMDVVDAIVAVSRNSSDKPDVDIVILDAERF